MEEEGEKVSPWQSHPKIDALCIQASEQSVEGNGETEKLIQFSALPLKSVCDKRAMI